MNKTITIDIIVPIYNCKNYLSRCIESLLGQKGQNNLRIILVDDGSSDGSREIVDMYERKHKNIIAIHQKNGGLSCARNAGLEVVDSDYFSFVDPDDWIESNYIEKVVEELNSNNVDVLMVPYVRKYKKRSLENLFLGNNTILFSKKETRGFVLKRFIGLTNNQLKWPLSIDNISTAWGKFYKTSCLGKIRFNNKEEVWAEDLYFNIKCFLIAKNSEYFPHTHYVYFKENNSSIVHTYDSKMLLEYKNLYKKIFNLIDENELGIEYIQALNNRIIINELGILRNVGLSDKNAWFKYKEIQKILRDQLYEQAFDHFDFSNLPLIYKMFYKCCRKKLSLAVYFMLVTGEQLKTKIKQ
ncbi:glycosyltransferase [Weissella confusa]|uniref:Glycosyltransferase 2-like domain-containing protein n=1 Tax=Limosilactobacillus reuteri TaxID=1598 RepID=A0A2T5Q1B8_LIMRT|nr:glycosyltransferase [Limosilactobacillus reuteri]MCW3764650.1 glycosyltransferase [Weissella confusa]PTV01200.1 hypothetical protein DB325_09805 [Limosilactobacillus reuteri]